MGAVKNAKINIFIQKSGCIINCAALSNSDFFLRGILNYPFTKGGKIL